MLRPALICLMALASLSTGEYVWTGKEWKWQEPEGSSDGYILDDDSSGDYGDYRDYEFAADKVRQSIQVWPGEKAELNCTTSSDITFCLFTAPDGTNFFLKKNIPYEDGRITYAGEDESTGSQASRRRTMESGSAPS